MRKKGPALYELIRDRHRAESYTAPAPGPGPEPDSDSDVRVAHWLSPGRTVRVPMGYFFFGVGLLLIVAWGAYAIGFHRAETIGEQRLQEQASDQFNDQFNNVRDPLSDLPRNPDLLNNDRGQTEQNASKTNETREQTPPPRTNNRELRTGLHLVEDPGLAGDPREEGMNYYQLMTSSNHDEVVRAAEFLNDNGLTVAVARVRSNNSRPNYVLQVIKPFPGTPERSAEGRQFKEQLQQLGRTYRRDHSGVDFDSLYPVKFQ